jgi:hypothetical protein
MTSSAKEGSAPQRAPEPPAAPEASRAYSVTRCAAVARPVPNPRRDSAHDRRCARASEIKRVAAVVRSECKRRTGVQGTADCRRLVHRWPQSGSGCRMSGELCNQRAARRGMVRSLPLYCAFPLQMRGTNDLGEQASLRRHVENASLISHGRRPSGNDRALAHHSHGLSVGKSRLPFGPTPIILIAEVCRARRADKIL